MIQLLCDAPFLGGYLLTITFLFGGVMGSFLNCVAYRMVHGGSARKGRSACPECGHTLGVKDLVPLFSWLWQRGSCRYCKKPIAVRYVLVELWMGICAVGLLMYFGFDIKTIQLMIFTGVLLVLSLIDLETGYLPDGLLVLGILNFIVFLPFLENPYWVLKQGIYGALALSVPLLFMACLMDWVLKRDSMGGGDIKLFFVVGLYLGWQKGLFCLILACILGIIFPLISKIRTEDGQGAFPFGPAIALATFLSFFIASPVVTWYLTFFK